MSTDKPTSATPRYDRFVAIPEDIAYMTALLELAAAERELAEMDELFKLEIEAHRETKRELAEWKAGGSAGAITEWRRNW